MYRHTFAAKPADGTWNKTIVVPHRREQRGLTPKQQVGVSIFTKRANRIARSRKRS